MSKKNTYYAIEIDGVEGSLAPYSSLDMTMEDFKKILAIEPKTMPNEVIKLDLIATQTRIKKAKIKMYIAKPVVDNSGDHVIHGIEDYIEIEGEKEND